MRGSSFGYLIKEGARNIYANPLMSFAGIGVLVACMLLIGSSVLFSLNVNQMVGYVEDQNEVVIFLEMGLTEEERQEVEDEIKLIGNQTKITFISGYEGLTQWITSLGEDGAYLEGLKEEEILPDSYRVMLDDLTLIGDTVESYEGMMGVEKVVAPYKVADAISNIKSIVYLCGISIVIILAVVSVVIIGNTIKITVFNRRKEINIMKLVGATDTFIRMPFFFEGLLLGLISATIAFLLLWGGYTLIIKWLSENAAMMMGGYSGSMIKFGDIAFKLYGLFLLGGMGIGAGGSMIFVKKHLKI